MRLQPVEQPMARQCWSGDGGGGGGDGCEGWLDAAKNGELSDMKSLLQHDPSCSMRAPQALATPHCIGVPHAATGIA